MRYHEPAVSIFMLDEEARKIMQKFLRILGWVLSVLGAMWILLCFLFLMDSNQRNKDAFLGCIMLAIIFGLPGGVILWRQRVRRKEREFHSQLLGYVKSLDTFTVEELARKIGRSEIEAEGLVVSLIEREELDLAFHRRTRQYMHRKRLKTEHKLLSRCPTCGAAIGQQIILEGEDAHCQYCDHSLLAPASR